MEINIYIIIVFCIIAIILIFGWISAQQEKETLASKLEKEKAERDRVNNELVIVQKQLNQTKGENSKLKINELKSTLDTHTIKEHLLELELHSKSLIIGYKSLSYILSHTIYNENNGLTTIKKEVDFIRNYIELKGFLRNTNGSIILFDNQIDESSQIYENAYSLPHLVSVCFLENAFKHGNNDDPNFLTVIVRFENNIFEFTVKNKIKDSFIKTPPGKGLVNLKERLNVFLPGKYDLNYNLKEKELEHVSYLQIRF